MDLTDYEAKRDFAKTSEPRADGAPESGHRFVVQKHAARRLHYDFRLEHDGVLLSWAVPKGPSLDPRRRRLAVRTEDHPVAYAGFEGVIPPGEYGGGAVQLWDRGTWRPLGEVDADLERGRVRFELAGERLRGRFTLVKTKRDWLLIKGRDEHARGGDEVVERHEKSVASGRTIEQIEAAGVTAIDPSAVPGARRRAIRHPAHQLATPSTAPPSGPEWLHELKLDGYRVLCHLREGAARLYTRGGEDWTARAASIVQHLASLPVEEAWLDGELVALDARGRTDFAKLQRCLAEGKTDTLKAYLFDVLSLDGYDLRAAACVERRTVLERLVATMAPGPVAISEAFDDGAALLREACALGAEGVVSKRRGSRYRGQRTKDWRKIRCLRTAAPLVVGFTEPSGAREGLGALLLAERAEDGSLRYRGKVGTGFDRRTLRSLRRRLDAMEIDATPLESRPRDTRDARWVAPRLRVRIRYAEETRHGRYRQPVYLGLETGDTEALEAGGTEEADGGAGETTPKARARGGRSGSTMTRKASQVSLTHPDRVLFEDAAITKRELATYYEAVAPRMLPLVRRRPLMLRRGPKGTSGPGFYQKHRMRGAPEALIPIDVGDGDPYAMIDDVEGLRALVQISALEIHVFGARSEDLEHPERCVFDLDPDEALPREAVLEAALEVRGMLEAVGLLPFCLSTGGKGLHVVVPLDGSADWEELKTFSKAVAESLEERHPDRYTANMAKRARTSKVFVDYLRNARGATAVAPYSTRARPEATVATPLAWDEVDDWAPRTVSDVLDALDEADPWEGYEAARRALP